MSSIPGFMTIMNVREMGKCSYGTWVHEGCVLLQLDKMLHIAQFLFED